MKLSDRILEQVTISNEKLARNKLKAIEASFEQLKKHLEGWSTIDKGQSDSAVNQLEELEQDFVGGVQMELEEL